MSLQSRLDNAIHFCTTCRNDYRPRIYFYYDSTLKFGFKIDLIYFSRPL